MRVVVDTNVLISGIYWAGKPFKILEHWAHDKFDLLVSKGILNEYYDIINRIDPHNKNADHWITLIAQNGILIKDEIVFEVCQDPKDNMFLNCAFIGKAKHLISGDSDLLKLDPGLFPFKIIKPANFLSLFK